MRRPEQAIQRAVAHHLQLRGAPNLVWFHVPGGGLRSKTEAAIFKGLGTKAGVSDLILLHGGNFFALELKAPGGRVSPAQKQFLDSVVDAGGYSAVAIGLDEALRFLESWKLLRGEVQ